MAHGDVTHLEIPVKDLKSSPQFYADLFGWQIGEPPGFEGYPMWQGPNQASGGAFFISDGTLTQPVSYVEVDSIDDTLEKVTAGGGSVVTPKQGITDTSWFAIFKDPDGNVLGIFEGQVTM